MRCLEKYDLYADNIDAENGLHGYYHDLWNQYYQKFQEYYLAFGTPNVPADYVTEDGYNLGAWVIYQRAKNRNGKLSVTHKKLLDEAYMIWNLNDEKWNIGYDKLIEYYEKYGNVDIVQKYVTEDGYKLGAWLMSFKESYKGKLKRRLTPDQIMMLNDLDIDWSSHDTKVLNSEIVQGCCFNKYRKVMLERMKHILEDLSYELDGEFTSKDNQKYFEDEIIKRMWR